MSIPDSVLADLLRQPSVTTEQYAAAIEKLLPFAFGDTSAARPSAMALLSSYNGKAWTMSVPDLCSLDWELFDAVMTVIHGRVELSVEPHNVRDNGPARFAQLTKEWAHLNLLDNDQ